MNRSLSGITATALVLALGAAASPASNAQPGQAFSRALEAQRAADATTRLAESRIDELSDESQGLRDRYRVLARQLEQAEIYNAYLERLIGDQARERARIARELEDFAEVQQGIVPLMLEMIDDLDAFIGLDLPFLLDERHGRIERLRAMMDRADVTDSEKFRQIMEAYQLEAAFGRDIEAYRGRLPESGREVEFLRIGRLMLAWQTPDRSEAGFWNPASRSWEPLPSRYRSAITQGLRIARAQTAPEILVLPIATPEEMR